MSFPEKRIWVEWNVPADSLEIYFYVGDGRWAVPDGIPRFKQSMDQAAAVIVSMELLSVTDLRKLGTDLLTFAELREKQSKAHGGPMR